MKKCQTVLNFNPFQSMTLLITSVKTFKDSPSSTLNIPRGNTISFEQVRARTLPISSLANSTLMDLFLIMYDPVMKITKDFSSVANNLLWMFKMSPTKMI